MGVVVAEKVGVASVLQRLAGSAFTRRLVGAVVTLLVIAYLTLFGLNMAERGLRRLPSQTFRTAIEAAADTWEYIVHHPTTYTWHKYDWSAFELVRTVFARSAALLVLSLVVAAAVGIPLGVAAAVGRRKYSAPLILLLSTLGMSTPSFLLGMFLWVINIYLYRLVDRPILPQTGFGWDTHLIMPTLVLATRPLAQIAQVTYVSLSGVLEEDYVRTARAKGLAEQVVRNRHALRNVLIPILTTVGTSLRFSLASLPVVEVFFYWDGAGETLLDAIRLGNAPLVTDLIVSLGLVFLLINLLLDLLYPRLDPRLRELGREDGEKASVGLREQLRGLWDTLTELWQDLFGWIAGPRSRPHLPPLPVVEKSSDKRRGREPIDYRRWRWTLRSVFLNPALLLGIAMVVGFGVLAVCGEGWTEANPFETHSVMYVDGVISVAPFRPSSRFPWGTDQLGRDVQALVLAGARRTLVLAFYGMVARVLVGTVLGTLAGWWRGGWLDRLVTGAIGVWAAFPFTLFAMIIIYALGIQEGMPVFVIAICVVGWGEIAQFVRGQVLAIKPQPYIDAARAVGTPALRILVRHVLPHLVAPLLVLGALEMGGVLMLLAELGFLGVFMGGGFQVDLAGSGAYSDVPEWGAQLANVRYWWRSYPWVAWYPGLAFFLAIMAFSVLGEGLRRFVQVSRINIGRLFNLYTVSAAVLLILGLRWVLGTTSPMGVYRSQAVEFDAQRAMEHIRVLSSPELEGRETGTPGADKAVEYIVGQMKEIGLRPAGMSNTYLAPLPVPRLHLTEVPRLEILDEQGHVAQALTYRQDFVEFAGGLHTYGETRARVMGLVSGPVADPALQEEERYDLGPFQVYDKVVLAWQEDLDRIGAPILSASGVLIITDDPERLERKMLYMGASGEYRATPAMYVTPEVAERLLKACGSSLSGLQEMRKGLRSGEIAVTEAGTAVHLQIAVEQAGDDEPCQAVIGYIPGTGAQAGAGLGKGLDSQVIMVAAYYDGLGIGPDGTLYPGANDNASGVAVMLEVARVIKNGVYEPKKTVVFVAWPGGERGRPLVADTIMSAKPGFNLLTLEAVVELSGVGAGGGHAIALGGGSSFRMVQLLQGAAGWMGVPATTRGRGPHFGWEATDRREALSVYLSWDGSDRQAHTSEDTYETIDLDRVRRVGETVSLAVTVLTRELSY